MKFLSLFAGIGGLDLGLERAGMTCVGHVEIDPFCRLVLQHHWPLVPIHDDITTLPDSFVPCPDLICGGFPCQDISIAGRQEGIGGARSGLWRHMLAAISARRPTWVLVENVPALRANGADTVLAGLEDLSYTAWPLVVGARHVGAPHRRDRVFIVAHSQRFRSEPQHHSSEERGRPNPPQQTGLGRSNRWPALPSEPQHEWEEPRLVADPPSVGAGVDQRRLRGLHREAQLASDRSAGSAQPGLGGAVDGLSTRLVRRWLRESLKALGNAVVPEVAYVVGRAILDLNDHINTNAA